MKELRRAMKMHRIFIVQELKRMMEYKGDFLTGVIGFLIVQVFLSLIHISEPTRRS